MEIVGFKETLYFANMLMAFFIDYFLASSSLNPKINKMLLAEVYDNNNLFFQYINNVSLYTNKSEYYLYNFSNNTLTEIADTNMVLPSNKILPILKLNDDIWFGCKRNSQSNNSSHNNLIKHNSSGNWEIPLLDSLNIGYGGVNCMIKDSTNSFVFGCGENGSLGLFKYINNNYYILNDTANKYKHSIRAITKVNNGHYWFGGGYDNGPFELAEYNSNGTIIKHFPPSLNKIINNVLADSLNNIWISHLNSNDGVYKYDGSNWLNFNTSNSGLTSNNINKIVLEPNSNNIWFCTRKGFSKLSNGIWTEVNQSNNTFIPGDYANNICFTDDHSIWYCTDSGLTVENNNNWETYTVFNSSLHNNDIHEVVVDNFGTAWISTDGGISEVKTNCSFANKSTPIIIYPNPTNGFFFIQNQSNSNLPKKMEIYNLLGYKVYENYITDSFINRFDVSNLLDGVYLIKIGTICQKIIIN